MLVPSVAHGCIISEQGPLVTRSWWNSSSVCTLEESARRERRYSVETACFITRQPRDRDGHVEAGLWMAGGVARFAAAKASTLWDSNGRDSRDSLRYLTPEVWFSR